MAPRLPEPHIFGQGDALACLVIWLMGVLMLLVFGVDWYQQGSPDWFLALLTFGSIVAPFGLILYKAIKQIRYEEWRQKSSSHTRDS